MKFISVRDFRIKPGKIWQALQKKSELVITSNGRPIGLLISVDEDNLENSISAYRRSRATLALDEIQKESMRKATDKITTQKIEREIKEVRRKRFHEE
ncbi:MAG: type II toxin-antitoxin system prevent-host-death family antitoxin [Candidatus Cloacimonetes bacterium]|nr:type II toxin-antitoxin system prevent-host-death family antitoxin [Candidatus Cloacimonadota bacterium]